MAILHIFQPGESALVAENLDANFQTLLNLINQTVGSQSSFTLVASSTAQAFSITHATSFGTAIGTSFALGSSIPQAQRQGVGAAVGQATDAVIGVETVASTATATGGSTAGGISVTSSVGTATGVATDSVIGLSNISRIAIATGNSTTAYLTNQTIQRTATAFGTSVGDFKALNSGATESNDQTIVTSSTGVIFASTTPGQVSTGLNSFSLTANPGIVIVNGVNDVTTTNVVELYYAGHVLYRENIDGTWFRWVSAGNWLSTPSPIQAFVTESVEGTSITATGQTILASSTVGSAASINATVGNGLDTFGLSANPGQVVKNGSVDGTTANAVQLYYHNHTTWHLNSSNQWFFNTPATSPPWTFSATTPVPTTPTINVSNLTPQVNTNTTFVVAGTYQAFGGPGNPTLQYADNAQPSSQSTTWSPSDKSASMTLSNLNLGAASTITGVSSVRSTTSFNAGKKIFELTASTITFNWECGLANAAYNLNGTSLGDDANGIGFQPNNTFKIIFNGTIPSTGINNNDANGARMTICVDFDNKLFWATSPNMRNLGNPWNNSASANPATGTGGISFSAGTGPWFMMFNEFDSGGGATLNTIGPFAVGIPAGFSTWDTASGGQTTWLALPSSVNVTPTTWNFVHPPIASQNPSATVSVRDAVNTGVLGVSNVFQVQTPGLVTLNPMTLDNLTFTAGQPAGSLVGHLSIPTSGGSFTGSVTCSDNRFQVTGLTSVRNVVTNAVLGAGSFPNVVFTATMNGAVNSPESLTVTLTAVTESPQATSVTTIGPTIVGSNSPGTAGGQLTWALLSGGKASLNAITQNITANVTQLYYINHTLYIGSTVASVTSWNFYNGGALTGGQLTAGDLTSTSTPLPNITLNSTTFPPNTNGATGITASLISGGNALPNTTWVEDSPSFTFVGNGISTVGSLPAGQYNLNITATIPS